MPDRAIHDVDGFWSRGLTPLNRDDRAKCLGIVGENPLSAPLSASIKYEEHFAIWPGLRPAPASAFQHCRF
jgi:hypothetical protein